MADAVTALTQWRPGRAVVRAEHTVVKEALPPKAQAILLKMADELDRSRAERAADRERIRKLEAVITRLIMEAQS